jgi:DNA polymerase-3 subunit epsilon
VNPSPRTGLLQRLFGGERDAPFDETRWVVVDVESSGLDAARDRLLAVAGVALAVPPGGAAPRIALGDSFEAVLRQDGAAPVDKANILVHGIGVGAQRAGRPAAEALAAFERWVGASPLVAFHSAFDETMLARAMRAALGRTLAPPWLDLAPLAALAEPGVRAHALDDWMAHFGIVCAARHEAAADVLATAELLLRLWPALRRQRPGEGFGALRRLTARSRWLGRG